MIRAFSTYLVVLFAAVWIAAGAEPAYPQIGYDRPGSDYASAAVANGDPAVCSARCEHDGRCRAWSFAYPPASGGPALCRLKHKVAPRVKAGCCVAGVRGGGVSAPRGGDLEYGIERTGGDYRVFATTPDPHGKPCAQACRAESRCRAFTYRRPGYGMRGARCYLKSTIKPPRHRPCCISGVIR